MGRAGKKSPSSLRPPTNSNTADNNAKNVAHRIDCNLNFVTNVNHEATIRSNVENSFCTAVTVSGLNTVRTETCLVRSSANRVRRCSAMASDIFEMRTETSSVLPMMTLIPAFSAVSALRSAFTASGSVASAAGAGPRSVSRLLMSLSRGRNETPISRTALPSGSSSPRISTSLASSADAASMRFSTASTFPARTLSLAEASLGNRFDGVRHPDWRQAPEPLSADPPLPPR